MEKDRLSATQIFFVESLILFGFSGFTKLLGDDNTKIFLSIAFCSCVLGLVCGGCTIIQKLIFNPHNEIETKKI